MSKLINADNEVVVNEYNNGTGKVKKVLERIFTAKVFQPDIMKRVKNFKDVCKEMGRNHKDYICNSEDPDEQMANATKMALLIARCFNGGEEADWGNSSQPKFFAWWKYTSGSGWSLHFVAYWCAHSSCGARLAFLNKAHAQYCAETFPEVYQTINNQFTQNGKA